MKALLEVEVSFVEIGSGLLFFLKKMNFWISVDMGLDCFEFLCRRAYHCSSSNCSSMERR